jgi:LemA protein
MKKNYFLQICLAILVIVVISIWSSYNRLVRLEEARSSSWGDVQAAYQRRSDLIPNLVEVVKGAASYEQTTLTKVIEARSKATSVTISPDKLNDAASMQNFQAAQQELSSALSRLMVVVEQYPTLTATENFKNLQEQLEGTENRIAYVREKFNELTKNYNTQRRKAVTSLWVKLFYPRFEIQLYFESQEGAENAPSLEKVISDAAPLSESVRLLLNEPPMQGVALAPYNKKNCERIHKYSRKEICLCKKM